MVWAATWLVGNLLGAAVVSPRPDTAVDDRCSGVGHHGAGGRVVDARCWSGLWLRERPVRPARFARHPFVDEYGLRFKLVDLIGDPDRRAVAARRWCGRSTGRSSAVGPTRSADRGSNATRRDLYDQAHGGWLIGLVAIVVIGAPIVEELVYRGLLQGAAVRRFNDVVAVVAVAAFFALIHFRWVEFPGLFVFGLVLGVCALRTGRLGMGIFAHMAFNATGLLLVARWTNRQRRG